MPTKNPSYPGDFIWRSSSPLELTVAGATTAWCASRHALSSLLNGKADSSGKMALVPRWNG